MKSGFHFFSFANSFSLLWANELFSCSYIISSWMSPYFYLVDCYIYSSLNIIQRTYCPRSLLKILLALIFCFTSTPQAPKGDIFPYPTLPLPTPVLTHDFRMSVQLNPRISVGKTPFGDRKWISFRGGSWSGSFGTGSVLVSSTCSSRSDYLLILATSLADKTSK